MIFLIELCIWFLILLLATKISGKEGLLVYVIFAAVIANVETTQMVSVFGHTIPGGVIPFGCLFLATDVSSELYGRKFSQKLALYATIALLLSSSMIELFSLNQGISQGYQSALGSSWRIAIASFSVYYICAMLDIDLYFIIGRRTKYKWLRNNVSTIAAQFVNAFLFIIAAFGWIGIEPVIYNWLISAGLALIDTPMIYLITGRDRLLEKEE